MQRLRRVDCAGTGWTRVKRGTGFSFIDHRGATIADPEAIARIRALAIPPAWKDVWICPIVNGHIQATGIDAKGRRQYRYHDAWRTRRDAAKFEHMMEFAEVLPNLRRHIALDLSGTDLSETRVLACAVRLLDLGFFRIGGEDYAEANGTYRLATMEKRHVTLDPEFSEVVFDYNAKHGQHRVQNIVDPDVFDVVAELKRRRSGGTTLLATHVGKRWVNVSSDDINRYVKEITGGTFTAKDFRTWNATVLMSVGLAVSAPMIKSSEYKRKRSIARAVKEVSDYLGNTPAVARKSYIDPRVIDKFQHGKTIRDALDRVGVDTPPGHPATQGAIEEAVLQLLS